jgi:hypothetical protein
MSAGYSGTPLARKLGIRPGGRLALIDAPDHVEALLDPMPDGVRILRRPRGHVDVAWLFTTQRARLERRIDAIAQLIHPDGALWVSSPKRASKVPTDVTEDVVRDVVLPRGLVDVKVVAVDDVWSGLKVVWRRVNR